MTGGGLTDTGRDGWEKAIAAVKELERMRGSLVEVGILEGKGADEQHEGTDLTVVAIASVHEFGATITIPAHEQEILRKISASGALMNGGRFVKRSRSNYATSHQVEAYEITIPARSFIRATVDEQMAAIMEMGTKLLKKVAEGAMKAGQAMRLWGEDIVARIREKIESGIAPPLAASTVKGRAGGGKGEGGDTPLDDTGHMLRSITYRVKESA